MKKRLLLIITIPWPPYDHTIHVNYWLKSSKDGKWIYYTYNQSGIREENEVVYKMGEIIPSNKK